ncbi:hypothetical protein T492DRAFT_406896, partial [Pavlovales sp. CCMP2436]
RTRSGTRPSIFGEELTTSARVRSLIAPRPVSKLGAENTLLDDHIQAEPQTRTSHDYFADDHISENTRSRANTHEDILQQLRETCINVKHDGLAGTPHLMSRSAKLKRQTATDETSDQPSPCLGRALKLAKTSFALTDAKDLLLSRAGAELKFAKCSAGKVAALVTHVSGEPTSSNQCRAFTLLQKGEVVGSSNACTEFLLLNQSDQVVGASNCCRAFIVLSKAGEPVESSNACTDFVLSCAFGEAAAQCGDDMNSQAITELHIEFVHPVANHHALTYPLVRVADAQLAKPFRQPRGYRVLKWLAAFFSSSE